MTAEIALLNRKAVALAADSIVTISGPSISKSYDSAEKIFEFSRNKPIGLMTYNNTEILKIPIEILVREFREDFNDEIPTIESVWPQFQDFIKKENQNYPQSNMHIKLLLFPYLKHIEATPDNEKEIALNTLKQNLKPIGSFLQKIEIKQFEAEFGIDIRNLIKENFPGIDGYLVTKTDFNLKLLELALEILRSNASSSLYTGIVFAGFGNEERFPSLLSVEIDGFYFGETRIVRKQKFVINRENTTWAIVPFAQKTMPERFIFGIDKEYEKQILDIMSQTVDQLLNQFKWATPDQKSQISQITDEYFLQELENLKKFASQNLEIIDQFSKKELAEYASSMVNFTSRYHRYSNLFESVGGPIDVAILSKNEGFVWINRKRYFDLDLNPSYCERRGNLNIK